MPQFGPRAEGARDALAAERAADRVAAHLLGGFLALARWRTLQPGMQSKGLGTCARQLIKPVATIKGAEIVVPLKRGAVQPELRLQVNSTPEPATAQVLAHLGLRLPKASRVVTNVVPKTAPESRKSLISRKSRSANDRIWAKCSGGARGS